ncbi:hypothetical protein GGI25_005677 [Coemansia spiralis]|uniref:Uncharacterized protein n=2 Tax=Coemansia TaxID=4863 RepID=A0A9W8KW13_9FUNG|nr:hypothetical protein BX070DRAFT_264264 [Coemansia spiralis]KAJ1987567.1 hypothetical protein EDC05_005757 [Coemansia umbellata]KAJ2619372.1 hypothetical protein GGI26_005876 [Coemansia sp. RSA 1358]KAJ2670925.1 hypothetical protein GGI25_005677 [Coemansia spiralis]
MARTLYGVLFYTLSLATLVLGKVKLDIYMMSRCPDAVRGMRDMAAVYYDNIKDVDLKFNYIGELNSNSTYGVACLHGDYEKLGPNAALQLVMCQNRDIKRIGTYREFIECLQTDSIANWLTVARCTVGEEGKKLLQENVANTQKKEIKTSLTFTLNGQKRCAFDSGHWVASEDGCPGGGSVPSFDKSIKDLTYK